MGYILAWFNGGYNSDFAYKYSLHNFKHNSTPVIHAPPNPNDKDVFERSAEEMGLAGPLGDGTYVTTENGISREQVPEEVEKAKTLFADTHCKHRLNSYLTCVDAHKDTFDKNCNFSYGLLMQCADLYKINQE